MNSRMMVTVFTVALSLSGMASAKVIYVDGQTPAPVQGLMGFWQMNDNAANKVVKDKSPNLIHGTSVRNTSLMHVAGKVDGALNFNGTTDQVDCGTDARILPDAWTVVAWVKCEDTPTPTLFSFGNYRCSIKLQNNGAGKPSIILSAGNYRTFDGSAWTTLKNGQWHHVAFTVPGTALNSIESAKMYLDGVPVPATATKMTSAQMAKTRVFLGNTDAAGTQPFKGTMDHVMILNRVMSDIEILTLFQKVTPGVSWYAPLKTIGDAITAAAADDEIWVKKGTFTLTQPLTVNKSLKLYGGFAGTETATAQRNIQANPTIVDGNNAAYHCFLATADATIDGFTIQRGKATGATDDDKTGGGIFAKSGTATITNCLIQNNTCTNSGAGVALSGNGAVQHCQITQNSAGSAGGGVYSSTGTLDIQFCQIVGNTAGNTGGGVFCGNNDPVIDNVTIQDNHAADGAGVYLDNSRAQFAVCTFSGNQATADGGGVNNFGGESESKFRNCRFAANTAMNRGGAVFSGGGTLANINHPELANCILILNQAQDGGALYFDQFASGDVLNCTISGNQAQRGGGMFVFEKYSYTRILNTIFWGDSAASGHPEIHFVPTEEPGSKPDNLEVYYSDIMTGWDHVMINKANVDLDPSFVDADGFDNNAQTWQDNDYRLMPGSPLIDIGFQDIGGVLVAPTADYLGTIRPQGAQYDMGAYEYASGQGLEFQADFDLDYSYTAAARTQTFTASTQSCDVIWWLGLTNASGGTETWNLNSVTFETANTLGQFLPSDPVKSGNSYTWSNLTVTDDSELEAKQTVDKQSINIPFTVTRAYEGNTIMGTGEMTTIVTVTPQSGLASFKVTINVAPAWTDADWWNGQYIGTVEHISAEVAGNDSGQITHRDTTTLQGYDWQFTNYTYGQPIVFTIKTRVTLNSGIPTAYLEPVVIVSGNRTADYGSETWDNGVLVLPNGTGRVILDSTVSMLTLDGYLPWYELTLPHFAQPITGDANNDNTTDLLDLLILSENWLMPCDGGNSFCNGADFDHNGKVDLMDFTILSEFWLRNN